MSAPAKVFSLGTSFVNSTYTGVYGGDDEWLMMDLEKMGPISGPMMLL